jgi:hypothetical protein
MAVFRVTLEGKLNGQMTKNVVHFWKDAAVLADMALLASDFSFSWQRLLQSRVQSAQTWQSILVQHITTGTPFAPVSVPVIYTPGTLGTDSHNTGVLCYVYKIGNPLAGRHGRGRWFQGGVNVGFLNNGVFDVSHVGFQQAMCNDLISIWGGAGLHGFRLVIAKRPPGADFVFADRIECRSYPGVQRRRNFFSGV